MVWLTSSITILKKKKAKWDKIVISWRGASVYKCQLKIKLYELITKLSFLLKSGHKYVSTSDDRPHYIVVIPSFIKRYKIKTVLPNNKRPRN